MGVCAYSAAVETAVYFCIRTLLSILNWHDVHNNAYAADLNSSVFWFVYEKKVNFCWGKNLFKSLNYI